MTGHGLPLIAVAAILTAHLALANETKQEVDRLRGTWRVVKYLRDGQELPADGLQWVVGQESIVTKTKIPGGKVVMAGQTPYHLYVRGGQHGIDIMPNYPPNKGKSVLGIYRLQGDILECCFQITAGPNRPTEFSSAPGSNRELIVLKREGR